MEYSPRSTPQVLAAGLELDDEGTCQMCGGTGGWPGVTSFVDCAPCAGTGLDLEVHPLPRND